MYLSRRATRLPMRSQRFVETLRVSARKWQWPSPGNEHQNWRLSHSLRMEVEMSEALAAPVRSWLTAPMDHDVSEAIERLRRAPDVQQIAVMPDVHLASEVCIGVVVATTSLIYPQAVGGDIGCGMLA